MIVYWQCNMIIIQAIGFIVYNANFEIWLSLQAGPMSSNEDWVFNPLWWLFSRQVMTEFQLSAKTPMAKLNMSDCFLVNCLTFHFCFKANLT